MYDLAIINGNVVTEDNVYKANIYIRDGKIAAVEAPSPEYDAYKVEDASGKYVFPGAVDVHMHVGEYQADFEDMQTSTMAAAAGGVTTCVDMPLNLYSPSVLTPEAVKKKIDLLSQESYIDYLVWAGLTPASIDKLKGMYDAGAASFKCFMSAGGNDFSAPTLGEIRQALKQIKEFDGLAGFHCEDYSIITYEKEKVLKQKLDGRQAFLDSRPLVSEIIATENIIELAREIGTRVHICHVSHPDVAALIEQAQKDGVDITAETCAHFLTFTEDDYLEKGCAYGCAPVLRSKAAREELWDYVNRGVLSCIASDHSPGLKENRSDENKPTYKSGYGISGVQTMFQTIFDQGVNKRGYDPMLLARNLAANPAKRWGIYGTKGAIKSGFDADLVILDPNEAWTVDQNKLYYKVKLTAFDGLSGKGKIKSVYIRGKQVVSDGIIQIDKGYGTYLGKK